VNPFREGTKNHSIFFLSLWLPYTGQAESGKSTILRNFQLKYAPTAFHAEAEAWRTVIDLNLVRSVTFLLSLLEERASGVGGSGSSSNSGNGGNNLVLSNAAGGSSSSPAGDGGAGDMRPMSPLGGKLMPLPRLTDDLRRLRVKLSPLRNIENSLVRVISHDNPQQVGGGSAALPSERAFEVCVRSNSRWKSIFRRNGGADAAATATSKASTQGYEELQNARRVIEACREDIIALWNHPAVQAGLTEQSVSLEFQSGLCVPVSLRLTFAPHLPPSHFPLCGIACRLKKKIHSFSPFICDFLPRPKIFHSSMDSFLDAVDRIAAPGYQPSPGMES
jgi:guanine nucleotide-binding protein alpha-1 subunit